MGDVPFKLIPEMADGAGYRPSCSISQWTNGIAFNVFGHIHQQINILIGSMPMFYAMQDLFQPASSFPARRTLSAAFMMIKSRKIPGITDDALIFIKDNKSSGPQHCTALKPSVTQ